MRVDISLVEAFLGYDTGSPLGYLMGTESGNPIGLLPRFSLGVFLVSRPGMGLGTYLLGSATNKPEEIQRDWGSFRSWYPERSRVREGLILI